MGDLAPVEGAIYQAHVHDRDVLVWCDVALPGYHRSTAACYFGSVFSLSWSIMKYACMDSEGSTSYGLRPLRLGVEVTGVSLGGQVDPHTVEQLRADVVQHKLLVFRNQGCISGERQIEITQWFGEIETAGFELHPKSPSRLILRVSNNEEEGFTNFGTGGFHIDGSFMENPNSHSIYHMVQAPSHGETIFVSLNDVYRGLTAFERRWWRRLAIMKTFKRIRGYQDEPGYIIHPLVYHHPLTRQKTLCIHLGKTSRFIVDRGMPTESRMSKEATNEMIARIEGAIRRDHGRLLYCHQWQTGDIIISDNLAVGHLATGSTQLPDDEIGLRIMHRTVTVGVSRPWEGACRRHKYDLGRCTLL